LCTDPTLRRLDPLSGVKSPVSRVIDHLGRKLALEPRKRFAKDAVLIVEGTLLPTRAARSTDRVKARPEADPAIRSRDTSADRPDKSRQDPPRRSPGGGRLDARRPGDRHSALRFGLRSGWQSPPC